MNKEDIINKIYQFREKAFSFINEAESVLNKIVLFSIIIIIVIWINLGRIIDLAVSEKRIKSNLVHNLEEITGKKADITGDVTFKSEPEAVILINNVNVHNDQNALTSDDYFHADVIKSKPSIFRAILGKMDFDNIYFENVKINLGSNASGEESVYDEINKSFSKKSQFYGKKLFFKDLEVDIYKQNPLAGGKPVVRKYVFPDFELIPNPEKKKVAFEVKGSIKSVKLSEIFYFDFDIVNGFGKDSPFNGRLYSDDSDLKLTGNLNTTEKTTFKGNITGKLTGFSKKIFSILGASEGFLDSVSENDESNITGDYTYDGTTFEISNLKGDGAVATFSFDSKTEFSDRVSSLININVSKLEYQKMFKTYAEMVSEKKAKKIERDFKKKLEEYFLFAVNDDVNFLFNLEAPSIKFFHDQEGSISFSALLKDNHFKIKTLQAKLPGESSLTMIGEVDINKELKQLKGGARVVFTGKKMDDFSYAMDSSVPKREDQRFGPFYIDAKAFFYGQNIHLREIVAKINDDTFAGQMLADYSNEFKASAAFNFTSLNIDKYLSSDNKTDLGIIKEENSLTSKFDFLRVIDSIFDKLDISLLADNMVKAGHNFTDVSLYAQITPGITEVKDIFFNSDIMGQVKGNAHLDLTDFQPKLDLNLNIDRYDSDLLIYGEIVNQNDDYNFDGKWSSEKVTFEKLGNFLGKMNLKIGELRIYHFLMKNFVMTSHAEEGKFVVDQARADLFGNKIDFKGYLTTEYPSFSISFIASELNSEDFMHDTLNLSEVSSIFNMSGVLATNGYSIEQMIQNLKGNISIATKGFTISSFGLESVGKALPLAKRREYVKLIADELLHKGETEFNFFIGAFTIDAGHITFSDLPIAGPNVQNAKVSGDIDLSKWEISLDSKMDVVTTDKGTFALIGKTHGSLGNFRTDWDTSGMMKYWEDHFFGGR